MQSTELPSSSPKDIVHCQSPRERAGVTMFRSVSELFLGLSLAVDAVRNEGRGGL